MKKYRNRLWEIAVKILLVYLSLLVVFNLLSANLMYKESKSILTVAALLIAASYLFSSQKKFIFTCGKLYFGIISILFICYQANDAVNLMSAIRFFSATGAVSMSGVICSALFAAGWKRKTVFGFVLTALGALVSVFWGYYFSAGAWFNADTLLAIMQTNSAESKEYLQDYFSWKTAAVLAAIGLLGFSTWRDMQSLALEKNKKYFTALLLLVILGNVLTIYKTRDNIAANIFLDAKKNLHRYEDFQKQRERRKQNIQLSAKTLQGDSKGVYVLVIGESQNRDNMSAYGYERRTTPWLEEMRRQDKFLLFEKAYSCHTHTVPVLTYALTAKNQYNDLPLAQAASLLEAAEAAGYDTVWMSNQVKYSAWDTPITVIASEANQQVWLNNNIGEKTATSYFDGRLADSFARLKLSDKMLIVVHLMGNHGSYRERYPKEFRQFTGRNSLDEYDNSILYNDFVMQKITEQAKHLPNFQGLVYFADHADAVQEGLSHDASSFVWSMTHIPMYMLFSDTYLVDNEEKFQQLRRHQQTVFTNDLLFNLMLAIMDIRIESLYEKNNDFTSAAFDDNYARFKTLYKKKSLLEERGVKYE